MGSFLRAFLGDRPLFAGWKGSGYTLCFLAAPGAPNRDPGPEHPQGCKRSWCLSQSSLPPVRPPSAPLPKPANPSWLGPSPGK